MPFININNATNMFWVIASAIGLCVCGALTLVFATNGLWKEATMYLFLVFCNGYAFETKRRLL